jgi:hypothetical protein
VVSLETSRFWGGGGSWILSRWHGNFCSRSWARAPRGRDGVAGSRVLPWLVDWGNGQVTGWRGGRRGQEAESQGQRTVLNADISYHVSPNITHPN